MVRSRKTAPTPDDATDATAPPDVGTRLRRLRKLYGLSQRELARRVGVTNGTISLVEQNAVSPTIASLKKILGGFPLSIAEFFGAPLEPRGKIFYRSDELTEIRGPDVLFRQVGPRDAGRRLQLLHERYEPGGDTGEAMLSHDGEEAGVVVSGHVEITVGGRHRVMGPGEAYYFDSRIPHRFHNTSTEPCEIVSACTPPTF